jgi:hypothetical protein
MSEKRYPDRTATARQRRRTERLAEAGLKKVPVIVPMSREDDIKQIAEKMREEHEMNTNRFENRYESDWDIQDKAASLLEVTQQEGGPHLKWFEKDGWNRLAVDWTQNGNGEDWRPFYEHKTNDDVMVLKDVYHSYELDDDWREAAKRIIEA